MAKKQNVRTARKSQKNTSGSFLMNFVFKLKHSAKWILGLVAGIGLASVLIVGTVWLIGLDTSNFMPLNRLEVSGQKYTEGKELHESLTAIKDRGFFTIDMQKTEENVKGLPWIKEVQLRKIWPNTLEIMVKEQQPLAFWGANGVVSKEGTVFYPKQLPQENWVELSGPEPLASQLTDLLQQYQKELDKKKLAIKTMQLSERGSIDIELNDGLVVKLGKVNVEERIQRLIEQIDTVKQYKNVPLSYIDLRYQNGLVAAWQDSSQLNDNQQ